MYNKNIITLYIGEDIGKNLVLNDVFISNLKRYAHLYCKNKNNNIFNNIIIPKYLFNISTELIFNNNYVYEYNSNDYDVVINFNYLNDINCIASFEFYKFNKKIKKNISFCNKISIILSSIIIYSIYYSYCYII